jgi:hypothetical protein
MTVPDVDDDSYAFVHWCSDVIAELNDLPMCDPRNSLVERLDAEDEPPEQGSTWCTG